MVVNIFATHLIITSLVLIWLVVPFSDGRDERYTLCSSSVSCGSVRNIGYPFWGGDRPAFCGQPEFQLSCHNGSKYPSITIPSAKSWLKVLSIDTSAHTMSIVQGLLLFHHPLCKGNIDILHMPTTNLQLSPNVGYLSLFYGCPHQVFNYQYKHLTCSSSDGNTSALYFAEPSEEIRKDIGHCTTNYTVPVLKRELDELNNGKASLLNVLQKGFEVEYTLNFSACYTCENSGGRCGSPDNSSLGFVCYCPGGPQPTMCPKSEKSKIGLIIGLAIAGGAITIVLVAALWYRKKLKKDSSKYVSRGDSFERTTSDLEKGNLYFGVPLFSYNELEKATGHFDRSRELGDGGFGTVYYGELKDGRKVAVKRLYEKSYRRVEQFMNEVEILTRLRHQNLVSLYGCTSHHCRELLLVYEYVPNGTVADHLFGDKAELGPPLPWSVRMRIALETASALSYLHASDIIHRDVKTNNILLDSSFNVKVADFGLSRLFPNDVTHVSTAPQGTPGYLDPEYHQCYQLTDKSDVYSFGVVLAELVSSMPAVDMERDRHEINLSNYAMNRIQRCAFDELVDLRLGFGSDFKITRMATSVAELAFRCLQHDKEFRPSMDEVLECLKQIEGADYEALEKNDEVVKFNKLNPPPSPSEEDDAKLLANHTNPQPHPCSPSSVMDKWGSRTTTPSTSK